ncbi:MAG: hypothetical protein PSY14_13805 [bacterium]|nr:hypothetical protein [bacterium]
MNALGVIVAVAVLWLIARKLGFMGHVPIAKNKEDNPNSVDYTGGESSGGSDSGGDSGGSGSSN